MGWGFGTSNDGVCSCSGRSVCFSDGSSSNSGSSDGCSGDGWSVDDCSFCADDGGVLVLGVLLVVRFSRLRRVRQLPEE